MSVRTPDPRLLALAGVVRQDSVAADIGADHGLLICHLVESGKCPRGYACDVGEKPLARAKAQIISCGLSDKIETRLTNGLQGLPLDEIDDVIIAGMGGELIAALIEESQEAKDHRLRFVLQPMTKAERLRRSLYRIGYELLWERGVRSGRFFYPVMVAAYTGECSEVDELFAWTGLLPRDRHPDTTELLGRIRDNLRETARGISCAKQNTADSKAWSVLAAQVDELLRGTQVDGPEAGTHSLTQEKDGK